MSVSTPLDNIDTAERVENSSEEAGAIDLSLRKIAPATEELSKSGNTLNGRNKNRKRKRHHNNNKNNNKKWCKKFKRQPSQHNKSDLENLQNVKNSNNNRKYGGMVYGGQKHLKPIFKNISHRNYRCISLPDKRLRKELIIPPTKFLLGGNISDPLNLNSLQDEALDTSENAATPKSSPITTPPKIEVIIPPNIFDPLHLLQPVDSVEYEKLLTAPLKRKIKHRNRKKKPRKRNDSSSTMVSSANSTAINMSSDTAELVIYTDDEHKSISDVEKDFPDEKLTSQSSVPVTTDRCVKDLRLDLVGDADGNSNRKRKNFECPNSHKKVRRMDSMDKIVSPVIPQPGAWKRPPPIVPPMGAPRNRQRVSSTSTSDDMLSVNSSTTVSEDVATATASSEPSIVVESPTANMFKTDNKQSPKKRPEKSKYQYGNHCSYKGFAALTENNDVRLRVFKQYPYLFQNKDVLDVGCHAGHVTLAIGRMLNPKSVLGVDIASNLISMANHNLSLFVKIPTEKPNISAAPKTSEASGASSTCKKKKHNRRDRTKASGFYPISFGITYKGIPRLPRQNNDDSSAAQNDVFPNNVNFKTMNYVETDDANATDAQQYDLIICLSVTKYIHLNFGDAGLKGAFKKMFNQLRPGGKLILEAQNWASYERSKNLTVSGIFPVLGQSSPEKPKPDRFLLECFFH